MNTIYASRSILYAEKFRRDAVRDAVNTIAKGVCLYRTIRPSPVSVLSIRKLFALKCMWKRGIK